MLKLNDLISPKLSGFLLALAIGTAGGYLFNLMSIPLAWMLGAMTFCTVAALLRIPISSVDMVRPSMTSIIGVLLGSSFTVDLISQAGDVAVSILVMFAYLLVSTLLGLIYFRRIAGFDRITALYAAMPGGLVEMTTLGSERGGNGNLIALVHASRILLVVASLPFLTMLLSGAELAGATTPVGSLLTDIDLPTVGWVLVCGSAGSLLGKWLRLPARYLVGPMMLSALVHMIGLTDFNTPQLLVVVAQIVLGALVGCRFAGTPGLKILTVIAYSVGLVAMSLALLATVVLVLASLGPADPTKLLLAYAPGGMTEMSLVALSVHVDVAFVSVHHIIRIAFVVVLSIALGSWLSTGRSL